MYNPSNVEMPTKSMDQVSVMQLSTIHNPHHMMDVGLLDDVLPPKSSTFQQKVSVKESLILTFFIVCFLIISSIDVCHLEEIRDNNDGGLLFTRKRVSLMSL